MIISPSWHDGSVVEAGAVTWGSGTTGVKGPVTTLNSLVGSKNYDNVGFNGVTALSNGNYVVKSPFWDNDEARDVGAVTWRSGETGAAVGDVVSAANSLVGSSDDDNVGSHGVTAFNNGDYVVKSPFWDNDEATDVGAVTWRSGETDAAVGDVVSASNSLVGSSDDDKVGFEGVVVLSDGNYVVVSKDWNNGDVSDAGAVTWRSGGLGAATGGELSASNSLVGSAADDKVGNRGIVDLLNGNYVVLSPDWDNEDTDVGAVTLIKGATGTKGPVDASNSLVGSIENDRVGSDGVTVLNNDNYVVASVVWNNGVVNNAVGAVTWVSGTDGLTGPVSSGNSLVGSTAYDQVGSYGVTALSNGNYVVASPFWTDGDGVLGVGAVTWGNGMTGARGILSKVNSLVGSTIRDNVGIGGVTALGDGNYVVGSPIWGNNLEDDAGFGAVTWQDGSTPGSPRPGTVVSASNSLVGSKDDDQLGSSGVVVLSNGNYVVISPKWDNGSIENAGAVTWASGATGVTGTVSASNSLVGSAAGDQVGSCGVATLDGGGYVVQSPNWDNASVADAGAVTYTSRAAGVSGVIDACNSVLGTVEGGGESQNYVYNGAYDYLLVGYQATNFYAIHNSSTLADDNTQIEKTIDDDPVVFFSDCLSGIGVVAPSGEVTPVHGPVTMKVHVVPSAPVLNMPYVRRYYEISPDDGANLATGRVTLFYSQAAFTNFNNHRGSAPELPKNPDDATGIANLRITQNHGTSATGAPGSYTGWAGSGPAVVLIDPENDDILWNSAEKRWEVSFEVTGFSGFFAHANVNGQVLPVRLVSFTAQKVENNALLQWKTASEENTSHFDVERSADGTRYSTIGTVQAAGNSDGEHSYSFTDAKFSSMSAVAYYRLRSVDVDGSYAFSRIEALQPDRNSLSRFVYPNPAGIGTSVTIKSVSKADHIQVLDLSGREIGVRVTQLPGIGFALDHLPHGMFLIKFNTQTGAETRKLVVE